MPRRVVDAEPPADWSCALQATQYVKVCLGCNDERPFNVGGSTYLIDLVSSIFGDIGTVDCVRQGHKEGFMAKTPNCGDQLMKCLWSAGANASRVVSENLQRPPFLVSRRGLELLYWGGSNCGPGYQAREVPRTTELPALNCLS